MSSQQPILSTGIQPSALQQQLQNQPPQPQGRSPLLEQLKQPPSIPPQQPTQQPTQGVIGMGGPAAGMNNQKERQNIWNGILEWHEKQKGMRSNISTCINYK